ncbi:unnamed protein product [Blepharisma stoltei]|uniref:Cyclic nucleotide-binding domain-containing protein n=1 Tax=Blepharisma stoltei TaxID=1481888 RepID=A0AAU9J0B0_9CILI|nr:unnamed protein product [Blepharisma stoltei]
MDTIGRKSAVFGESQKYLLEIQEQINRIKESNTPSSIDEPRALKRKNTETLHLNNLIDEKPCDEKYLFNQENRWRVAWDILIIISVLHEGFIIPFSLAFDYTLSSSYLNFEIAISLIFFVDIGLCFNTTFFRSGITINSRKLITINYLQSWFILDIISSFPYEIIISGSPSASLLKILKLIRFLRIFKLARVLKLRSIFVKIEEILSSELFSVFIVIAWTSLTIFFIAHWSACTFYAFSKASQNDSRGSWIFRIELEEEMGISLQEKYITTLYWAFTTMYTVGYGDIHALNSIERLVAIMCMVITCGYYAYLLGKISSIVMASHQSDQKKRDITLGVNRYMKKLRLPKELQDKVKRYIDYVGLEQESCFGEEDVLKLLSDNLRDEISSRTHGKILLRCRVFPKFFPLSSITSMTKLLRLETFAPGDGILAEGERSRKLYFISTGSVNIFHQNTGCAYIILNKNEIFGEIGFFTGHRRTASAQCESFTEVMTLDWVMAIEKLQKQPEIFDLFQFFKVSCEDNNYKILGIQCYFCNENGHVAKKCTNMVISSRVDMKTVEEYRARHRMINPYTGSRAKRRTRRIQRKFDKINIVGIEREPEEQFPLNLNLQKKIYNYHTRKDTKTQSRRERKTSIQVICDDSEDEELKDLTLIDTKKQRDDSTYYCDDPSNSSASSKH